MGSGYEIIYRRTMTDQMTILQYQNVGSRTLHIGYPSIGPYLR